MPTLSGLKLELPLMLAPLGGGPGTPALAAAVSEAGGLGTVGSAYFTPAQIVQAGQQVRALTGRPFALNMFVPAPAPVFTPQQEAAALAQVGRLHAELGLAAPTLNTPYLEDFEAQFQAVLTVRPAVLSFTFGRLEATHLKALREAGILSLGTATSVQEAHLLAADGVDGIIMQGAEAGGHRGSWLTDERLDTVQLVRQVRQRVAVPLIAAGGLMTRQDVQAALKAGATLAALGTAFLLADEAGTNPTYRQALAQGGTTDFTRAFTGRWARGLINRAFHELSDPLPTPAQHALTRPLRQAAAQAGRSEFLSLWAGTGVNELQSGPASALVHALVN